MSHWGIMFEIGGHTLRTFVLAGLSPLLPSVWVSLRFRISGNPLMAKAKAWLICLPSGVWEMPTLDLVLLNINVTVYVNASRLTGNVSHTTPQLQMTCLKKDDANANISHKPSFAILQPSIEKPLAILEFQMECSFKFSTTLCLIRGAYNYCRTHLLTRPYLVHSKFLQG